MCLSHSGASRYRGSGPSAQPAASTYSDPYTGASRYIGNATPSAPSSAPSSGDPFTGASRYVNTPPSQPSFSASPSKSIIPVVSTPCNFCIPRKSMSYSPLVSRKSSLSSKQMWLLCGESYTNLTKLYGMRSCVCTFHVSLLTLCSAILIIS